MTAVPRAIVGPVMGMARPRRPVAEFEAVREAAEIVRAETGLTSAKGIAREIARRVVAEMLADLERDDPLTVALAALEHKYAPSPIHTLATCGDIDVNGEFVERRVGRLKARSGSYLSPAEQAKECSEIAANLLDLLAGRYDRHIRS